MIATCISLEASLNRAVIAQLIAKHHSKLPQALSMGIGSVPDAACADLTLERPAAAYSLVGLHLADEFCVSG